MRDRFVAEIVGGPRARDVFSEGAPSVPFLGEARAGSFVEVEVREGVAHPIAEVAARGSALARLVQLAAENQLDPIFSPAVRAEVRAMLDGATATPPGIDDPALEDLDALPFVTIDNEGSRDLDQALYVEEVGEGHRVLYALADAAYYVRPGTALFAEALARGASYYLPGWMVPMLPRELSEGVVSLNEAVPRRALVFDMRLDGEGRCVETRVSRARMKSRAKLTYVGVQAFLDQEDTHPIAREPYAASLRALRTVGLRRIALAVERDVVHYRRRTVEVGLEGTRSFVVYGGIRNDVERYNEQISLLCNEEGAAIVRRAHGRPELQPIYRVHPPPPEERVDAFEREVAALTALHGLEGRRWRWDRRGGQSLASFLEGLPEEGEGARLASALQRQAILMNVRSTFTASASEHHGVGVDVYARFSSPMREIVGVFLHKELTELGARGPTDGAATAADEALAVAVIDAANAAKQMQTKLTSLANLMALDQLFDGDRRAKKHERPRRRGTVMGLTAAKIHVSLDDPPIDVKLYRGDLEQALGARLRLGPGERTLLDPGGRVIARTGDAITLRVSHHDAKRGRWVLVPVE